MESCPSLAFLLRRLLGVTVIGAAVLLFAGQIMTILMMAIVCATVGFLVWLPLHTVFFGRNGIWPTACEHGRRWRQPMDSFLTTAQQKLDSLLERFVAAARDAIAEMTCGALVGALVAVAAETSASVVLLAALVGGVAGMAVSLAHLRNLGS